MQHGGGGQEGAGGSQPGGRIQAWYNCAHHKKFQLNWTSGSRDNPAGANFAEQNGYLRSPLIVKSIKHSIEPVNILRFLERIHIPQCAPSYIQSRMWLLGQSSGLELSAGYSTSPGTGAGALLILGDGGNLVLTDLIRNLVTHLARSVNIINHCTPREYRLK